MSSLAVAFQLLELLGSEPGGLTHAQIWRKLKLAKSSCSYILAQLEKEGCVFRDGATGRYRPGARLISLAGGALAAAGIRRAALPALKALATRTSLSVRVGVLERDKVVLIELVEPEAGGGRANMPLGSSRFSASLTVGTRIPIDSTAVGKVLLAHLDPLDLCRLIDFHGLPLRTRKTVATKAQFVEELKRIRRQGYALGDEHYLAGLCSIAAPIVKPSGQVWAALAATGEAGLALWQDPPSLAAALQDTARELSKNLALGLPPAGSVPALPARRRAVN